MAKNQSTMRRIIKFLLDNTLVEFTAKDIAINLNQTGISWHTSRLKAFIIENKDVSDILQVRTAKKRESVFMCKAKAVDDPDEWATKLYNDYLEWERQGRLKEDKQPKAEAPKKPKDNGEVSVPVSFNYNSDEPIEIPINLKITISVKIAGQA
jgi:hypothetical protein